MSHLRDKAAAAGFGQLLCFCAKKKPLKGHIRETIAWKALILILSQNAADPSPCPSAITCYSQSFPAL